MRQAWGADYATTSAQITTPQSAETSLTNHAYASPGPSQTEPLYSVAENTAPDEAVYATADPVTPSSVANPYTEAVVYDVAGKFDAETAGAGSVGSEALYEMASGDATSPVYAMAGGGVANAYLQSNAEMSDPTAGRGAHLQGQALQLLEDDRHTSASEL